MPILANAKKALRVSKRRAVVNGRVRSQVKTSTDSAKKQPSLENLKLAFSSLDRAVKMHIMHRNKAARVKSQLNAMLPKQEAPAAAKKAKTTAKKA